MLSIEKLVGLARASHDIVTARSECEAHRAGLSRVRGIPSEEGRIQRLLESSERLLREAERREKAWLAAS